MEIKVLCKSDVCLAMCQITRGLHYIAFKLAASENSTATPNRPKNNIACKSGEFIAYFRGVGEEGGLWGISYFTHNISPIAIKVINNPPLIFIPGYKLSCFLIIKLHKNNTRDKFFIQTILHCLQYKTKCAREAIKHTAGV